MLGAVSEAAYPRQSTNAVISSYLPFFTVIPLLATIFKWNKAFQSPSNILKVKLTSISTIEKHNRRVLNKKSVCKRCINLLRWIGQKIREDTLNKTPQRLYNPTQSSFNHHRSNRCVFKIFYQTFSYHLTYLYSSSNFIHTTVQILNNSNLWKSRLQFYTLLLYGQTKPVVCSSVDATHCERNKQAFDKIEIVNNCSEKGGPHANLNSLTFFI